MNLQKKGALMFGKKKESKEVTELKMQIAELEGKLSRSQGAFIQAKLAGREPDEEDIRFHDKYMKEIETLREKIKKLEA